MVPFVLERYRVLSLQIFKILLDLGSLLVGFFDSTFSLKASDPRILFDDVYIYIYIYICTYTYRYILSDL